MPSHNKDKGPRLIVALDYADSKQALQLVEQLNPHQCRLKVGKELFTRCGPAIIAALAERDFDVFLDLKFHDIPNTVAKACQAAADLGVWMINVHASGGRRMLEASREAVEQADHRPLLIAVTILTSLSDEELHEIGYSGNAADNALRLAKMTQQAGLDGVVCSSREVAAMRAEIGADFSLVTPGIRPLGAAPGDQRRIMTPTDAIKAGADYLVVGRPITAAAEPMAALESIHQEIIAA